MSLTAHPSETRLWRELDLPEYQHFFLFRKCDEETFGPFSQSQIVRLLNEGKIHRSDLVSYNELGRWERLDRIFDFHDQVAGRDDDAQEDRRLIDQAFFQLVAEVRPDENFYEITVQPGGSWLQPHPRFAAVSDEGVWLGKLGPQSKVARFRWEEIHRVRASYPKKWDQGGLMVLLKTGEMAGIERGLPRRSLQRLVDVAQDFLS
ncbi:MAG: hypothetical protein AAF191_14060 [Verrucomicrobiota bacterium]